MIPYTLILDESISQETGFTFESFLKKRKIQIEKVICIAQKYPGMPDDRIIIHLLNNKTILLTSDRPFHNKVLEKGMKSYYYNGNGFCVYRFKEIKTSERFHKRDLVLNNSFQLPETPHRSLVMCLSDKQLKKMRTKRRRIRNHFGGVDHMMESAVTISLLSIGKRAIIGLKIKISSNIGIKGLDASENYFEETPFPYLAGDLALFYALILPIQLMLHPVKTIVYYDTRCITHIPSHAGGEIGGLWELLKNTFKKIDFIPVHKGPHLERLRRKLADVNCKRSNEIVPGYFRKVMENYRCKVTDPIDKNFDE